MKMGEKKNPRIPPWKVWILVLSITQAVSVVQNFRSHQLLWNAILQQDQAVVEYIENQNQHSTELKQYLIELNQYLTELKQTLELIRGKFQEQYR